MKRHISLHELTKVFQLIKISEGLRSEYVKLILTTCLNIKKSKYCLILPNTIVHACSQAAFCSKVILPIKKTDEKSFL
jgi:hypothetical protein